MVYSPQLADPELHERKTLREISDDSFFLIMKKLHRDSLAIIVEVTKATEPLLII